MAKTTKTASSAGRPKPAPRKKVVVKPAPLKRVALKKVSAKPVANKRPLPPRPKQKKPEKPPEPESESGPSLGRPVVTGEERLFMLFKDDFHARQIFDFLRVEKVKDLEQYSPQQIVKLLSRPITETVNRIRRKLAEKNRCLREDTAFAIESKSHE